MNDPKLSSETFFFWLTFEDKIDEQFVFMATELAKIGVTLLPAKIDQISRLASLSDLGHVTVICSTRQANHFAQFEKTVGKVLPLLLRQQRLTFFHLSSYKKLDLSNKLHRQKNYFFLKYPLNLENLCGKLKRFHELRLNRAKVWPGGRRAKVPGLAA